MNLLADPASDRGACGLGFVARADGRASHEIVEHGLEMLRNLAHRGASGCDPDTGDGAGMLLQMPHDFLRGACAAEAGFELPEAGGYAAGTLFFTPDNELRHACERELERIAAEEGHPVLGWRDVPVRPDRIGHLARETAPVIRQVFLRTSHNEQPTATLRGYPEPRHPEGTRNDERRTARRLYLIRRRFHWAVQRAFGTDACYVVSLSTRTLIYKGLLRGPQLAAFYPDLIDPRVSSALAVIHSRFSTNTLGSWPLAHPFRYIAHNGEINALRGNINWMRAREHELQAALFPRKAHDLGPIVQPGGSDTSAFDNVFEFLVLAGRSLPHAMMTMVPEAWENKEAMDPELRAFYRYTSALMPPWDGPAAIVFSDGRVVGATLDRNGLRPARYSLTRDGLVILASEEGALPVPPEDVTTRWRLQPGTMLLVDTARGRILGDAEIKHGVVRHRPYGRWVEETMVRLGEAQFAVRNSPFGARDGGGSQVAIARDPKGTPTSQDGSQTGRNGSQRSHEGLARARDPEPTAHGPQPTANEQRHPEGTWNSELRTFGYTEEDLKLLLAPMAAGGKEPDGSMGTDTPLAVLSERPQLLFSYFKQLFAQVSNPPIDPLRERLVMSLQMSLGPEANFVDERSEHARQLLLDHPILTNQELERVRALRTTPLQATTLPMLFPVAGRLSVGQSVSLSEGCKRGAGVAAGRSGSQDAGRTTHNAQRTTHNAPGEGLRQALDELCREAKRAIERGTTILILSDRGVDADRAPIPSLLATAAVHHFLIREHLRTRVGLVVETGEAREVHHIALLIGYGAAAVNPYLALEVAGTQLGLAGQPADRYVEALCRGLLKVISRMGISTLVSYCGAQVFEAIGLDAALIDSYFPGTASRVGGIGLEEVAREVLQRRTAGRIDEALEPGGEYQLRREGEHHAWNPDTIVSLQRAVRSGRDPAAMRHFAEFTRQADEASARKTTLRGLLEPFANPIPLGEVEPAEEIVKRFSTGAMSFGSISKEAHETLAIAMNRIGGRSNTGEGGEEPERFGDERRSAIKQVASARFGVTTHYLVNADMLQIKIAQGAKPGEGGQLPGHKVSEAIARARHSTPGVGLISPPPHHDIYSIEDLAQLIHDLRQVNPRAEISVKLVAAVGVGTIAAGVAKAGSDHITIAGYDGGTGASPLSSIKHVGLPWELGLSEARQILEANGLRDRVRLQADGGLKTARDVVIAALLGADEMAFSTAPLIAAGCIMMRACHLNTCPVGIATQNPELRRRFAGTPEHIINYFFLLAERVRELMAHLGFRHFEEMVGRTDRLHVRRGERWKAREVDVAALVADGRSPFGVRRSGRDAGSLSDDSRQRAKESQVASGLSVGQLVSWSEDAVGRSGSQGTQGSQDARPRTQTSKLITHNSKLIANSEQRIVNSLLNQPLPLEVPLLVRNVDRAVGTRLSGEIARRYGPEGLPQGSITLRCRGIAGQSFGAWAVRGVTLLLEGETNDYAGKGLSGGTLAVRPPDGAGYEPERSIVVGNVALYGATSGEAYFRGVAGERFAVRNSGAHAVVEGTGDHACEYMTGGVVVVLGSTGRNFGAGMSGGAAYVLDIWGRFHDACNRETVDLEGVEAGEDVALLRRLLTRHLALTGSAVARRVVDHWPEYLPRFVKVMPHDVKKLSAVSGQPSDGGDGQDALKRAAV